MTQLYEAGKPTAADLDHLESIRFPVVYLDWNVLQYLAARPEADRLLDVLTDEACRNRLLFPYSAAHLMDATALWESASTDHRATRLRHMVFVDGLSGPLLWRSEGDQYVFERVAMRHAADVRGMFTSTEELRRDAAELSLDIEAALQARLAEVVAEAKKTPDGLDDPRSRKALLAMTHSLMEVYGAGLLAVSDGAAAFAKVFAPMFLLQLEAFGQAPKLSSAHPAGAVAVLNEQLTAMDPALDVAKVFEMGQSAGQPHHPDDLGPIMLGLLGYYPDRAKKVRRGAPGLIADCSHARFALDSALFVTGDEGLGMRVDAWAHHTSRGLANGKCPVVSVINPSDRSDFDRTADLVLELAEVFPDAMKSMFSTAPTP